MLYTELALLTAGVSFSIGAISLFIGLQIKSKTEIIFGMMGLSLVIFFLLPPTGFILEDTAPYPSAILVKRIFIFSYYGTIPWFILSYTGYGKKITPLLITLLIGVIYIIMFMTTEDKPKPIWSMIAAAGFGSIFIYGLTAGIWQYRKGEKEKGKWLILAMAIYGFLFVLTAINQLTHGGIQRELNLKLFFPMHFHSIVFMLIIGLRVVADVVEKHRLQKILKASDQRWISFMEHIPSLVLELDVKGNIVYINNFGSHLLGYLQPSELLQKNWFDNFAQVDEAKTLRNLFNEIISEQRIIPYLRTSIRNRHGNEFTIDWSSFLTFSEDGQVFGIMSIGRDLSNEEIARLEIKKLKSELEKETLSSSVANLTMPDEIIGSSDAIRYVIQKANQVATTQAPVLLEGETGVGKEMVADLIYGLSLRKDMPFIKVNCGALPKELIEDEFFGHEKGAFTSAIQARKGRFELADGGTIFLDEIGELPIELQPKLLRVLQAGEFERVGGQKTIKVNVRIIAATNRDMQDDVSKGKFRSDLFYRLNVFPITIPSLRQRKEDIPLLIRSFVTDCSQKYGKTLDHISKADMQRLIDYPWPGNIRELKNVIERAAITSTGSTLKLDWFLHDKPTDAHSPSSVSLEQIEKEHILKVMEESGWRINGDHGAAERLGMHPNTLRSRMKKLGILRPAKEPTYLMNDDG